jgi:N-acetylglutamate synthase
MIQALGTSTQARADRLHDALSTTFEGVFSAIGAASFERRVGHVRLLAPHIPIRVFNGVLVDSEPCSGIADSIREVEERGLPCGVQVRAGKHPDIEEEVARLGFSVQVPMPGMTASLDELVAAQAPDLEITRVADEASLTHGARIAADAVGAPVELMQPLFAPGLLELPGFDVYLGRVDGDAVTVAMAYRTGDDVGIFNVGTPPRHRRRGYGGEITAHAARAAFDDGADLAWLQTSEMGESVYRSLGFRHVELHFLLRRP